ncbi:hypothetical protein BHE74_00059324 [Ensete ventricosum]|nr:hypothetical protein BHE74_00059324 [Ensete ventricosum]RZS26422.1 hypothetical protein BHM03_00059765 [Ensete ventricosum]
MERHNPTLASTRVHVLDQCIKKTLFLCSMFYLLRRLPSCGLDTSLSSTQVTPLHDLHLVVGGPHAHHSTGQSSIESDFHIDTKCAFV